MTKTQLKKAKSLQSHNILAAWMNRTTRDLEAPYIVQGFKVWKKFDDTLNMVRRLKHQYNDQNTIK